MYTIIWLFFVAIIVASGLSLGHVTVGILRRIRRASDKNKIRAAMDREAYYNQLYEEALYEEMDDIATQAASDMLRAEKRRRY